MMKKVVDLNTIPDPSPQKTEAGRGTYAYGRLIGNDKEITRVFARIAAASQVDSPVLIYGESGTGKELAARAVHYSGQRAEHPFIPVNCSALPAELIESELFGYKRGAFTGAVQDSKGLFRAADQGVLFLDEITEMPNPTQSKMLRVLQDRMIRPIGGTEERAVDVRIIAASNRYMDEALRDGTLRRDLYYRLSVIQIHMPPLRRRKSDIPLLVKHFASRLNQRFHREVRGMTQEALDLLMADAWPGNVRELEKVLEGIFVLNAPPEVITVKDLPSEVRDGRRTIPVAEAAKTPPVRSLHEVERDAIAAALKATEGNKSRAAELLEISRSRLYKKIKQYQIPT